MVQGCGGGFAANINSALCAAPLSLPHWGRGTAPAVDRVLPLSAHWHERISIDSFIFHTASALSAPTGHLPLEGKADDTRETCDQETFGHRHYLYSAALLIFMRRTTIPNS